MITFDEMVAALTERYHAVSNGDPITPAAQIAIGYAVSKFREGRVVGFRKVGATILVEVYRVPQSKPAGGALS